MILWTPRSFLEGKLARPISPRPSTVLASLVLRNIPRVDKTWVQQRGIAGESLLALVARSHCMQTLFSPRMSPSHRHGSEMRYWLPERKPFVIDTSCCSHANAGMASPRVAAQLPHYFTFYTSSNFFSSFLLNLQR